MKGKLRYFTAVVRKRTTSTTKRASTARKTRASGKRTQARAVLPPKQKSSWWSPKRIWLKLLSLCFMLGVIGLLVLLWFASELPDLDKLESYDKPPGIRIFDTSENLIGSYGHVVGKYVAFDGLPKHLIQALLATEDRRFFEHVGVDPMGIARAMYHNIVAGGVVQGGSTITQQLAKNTFLTPARTFKRKIQEVMLSVWIENHFSKEKIVEIYFNRVYLGAGNYGIDAASRHYFNKSATDLNLEESALLVGLLKAPSRYAPTRDKELSFKRTQQVILNMKDAKMLNDRAASEAIAGFEKTINLQPEKGKGARYFADWVVDLIPTVIGQVDGDIEVYTTLNPRIQNKAETTITSYLEKQGGTKNVSQAALLTMSPDGAIKAMVGGVDYNKNQFNRITQARRQPGSAFKLFVYLAALESGLTPNSWVMDKRIQFGGWSPRNYNGRYLGDIKLREAFFRSVNTVAVQLARQVGIGTVIKMARRLGVKGPLSPNLSLALGAGEMTMLDLVGAYSHLANNGKKTAPYAIRKITNQMTGELIYERTGKETKQGEALGGDVTRMMNDMLTDTVSLGTGRSASFGRPAAGKTGTTNDNRDAWFIGFTPQFTTGVWVGNDDNKPTKKITGGSMPALIWRDVMKSAHAGLPVLPIPQHYQRFNGSPMQGDIYSTSGANLPWNQGVDGGSAGRPNQALPWERETDVYTPPARSLLNGSNPRHGIHRGAPVTRDVDLPTSQRQAPKKASSESSVTEEAAEWVRDSVKSREYDYPEGGRRGRKRRLFD